MSKIQTNTIQHTANGAAVFTLPTSDGSSGQFLKTNASGALSFASGGKILQIVQASTSSEVTTSSETYVDSGLSGSITTTGSNKVLVIVNQQFRMNRSSTQALGGFRLMRGSTVIEQGPNGASESNPFGYGVINTAGDNYLYSKHTMSYLDSPSAGTHTYKTQMAVTTSLNSAAMRAQYNASSGANGTSYIILMEVSA